MFFTSWSFFMDYTTLQVAFYYLKKLFDRSKSGHITGFSREEKTKTSKKDYFI